MIETREQAEQALAELGKAIGQIKQLEGRHQELVARSEGRLAEKRGLLEEKIFDLEGDLEAWTRENLTGKKKSINLVTGKVGLKKSPPKVEKLLKPETIIARLRSQGLDHCVKTEPKVNGKALTSLSDDQLKKVGCRRVPGADKFYADPKGETVTDGPTG